MPSLVWASVNIWENHDVQESCLTNLENLQLSVPLGTINGFYYALLLMPTTVEAEISRLSTSTGTSPKSCRSMNH